MRLAQSSSRIKETHLFGFIRPTRGECTGVKGQICKVVQPWVLYGKETCGGIKSHNLQKSLGLPVTSASSILLNVTLHYQLFPWAQPRFAQPLQVLERVV